MKLKLFTMYEVNIDRLALVLKTGAELEFPEALASGRANYIIFESVVRHYSGLLKMTGSDHKDSANKLYEQKAYEDPEAHPKSKDLFRCSSSSTFAANNHGPKIKKFLESGNYKSALKLCMQTGYNKNDFYVFTNSGKFKNTVPFRFFIIPKTKLLEVLDLSDPRLVSRSTLLSMIKRKVVLV